MKPNHTNLSPFNRKSSLSQLITDAPLEFFSFLDGLFEERYSIRQVGIERQELQFWRNNNLVVLPESPSEKREWVKVSFFDLIWLKLIAEMRRLGIPFEIIKEVKKFFHSIDDDIIDLLYEQLLTNPIFHNLYEATGLNAQEEIRKNASNFKLLIHEKLNHFILLTLGILDNNSPTYLIIEPNKEPELISLNKAILDEIDFEKLFLRKSSFYTIYLNPLFDSYFQNEKISEEDYQRTFKLTKAERQIIQLLRKEGVKEVRVRFNQQRKKGILTVEIVENADLNTMKGKLNGILEKGKFKQVVIQTEGNNLVFVEQTTKLKIEND